MTQEKMIKQLMGMGLQRNDAAWFVRAYRRVVAMGREDLFPLLMPREEPNVTVKRRPGFKLCSKVTIPDTVLCTVASGNQDVGNYVRMRLARELAGHLVLSGAMHLEDNRVPGLGMGATEFTCTVVVLQP